MSSHRRGPWSQEEDAYLYQLVQTQGTVNWVRIAKSITSRSPKQCRERYHQNLKPSLNHEPISPEEGLLIERLVGEMGKCWTEIARRLNGRSDNAVKNWWNGSRNRQRRLRRRTSSQHCPNAFDERAQPLFFARPAAAASQAVTITSNNSLSGAARQGLDVSLPSLAVSEDSRAESVDAAPSLVSDSGSAFSVSPRLATSPNIELAPLSTLGRDARSSSLPMIFLASTFVSEVDSQAQAFSMRSHADSKFHGLASFSSPYPHSRQQQHEQEQQQQRQETHVHTYAAAPLPPSPRDHYYESRSHQVLTAPPTRLQLRPLQIHATQHERLEPPASERDSRMQLSSLLA